MNVPFSSVNAAAARRESPPPGDTVYDVVIRNGRVLDGMGNPYIYADVGIRGGAPAGLMAQLWWTETQVRSDPSKAGFREDLPLSPVLNMISAERYRVHSHWISAPIAATVG